MIEHLRDLVAHMAWADATCFRHWAEAPEAAREDPELRERQSHAAGTQAFFLEVLKGEHALDWEAIHRGEVRPPWLDQPLRGFAELEAWSRRIHADCAAYAAGLGEADLARQLRIPWFPDPPCVVSVAQALVQASMHTQHHRGQQLARLKQLGGRAGHVDFIVWLWRGRPAPAWPDLSKAPND